MATTINGSAGVVTNSGAVYDGIQSGTAVTASGTQVNFTGIPSWVKRITVMFSGVSTSGTSIPLVQLGDSGGVETTGYNGTIVTTAISSYAGFPFYTSWTAATLANGIMILSLLDSATNTWTMNSNIAITGDVGRAGGSKALSATLDRVRITTVNGTDTFDAGSINILYE
jgi:hypothetical protein